MLEPFSTDVEPIIAFIEPLTEMFEPLFINVEPSSAKVEPTPEISSPDEGKKPDKFYFFSENGYDGRGLILKI